jgi:hypothetical protein
VSNSSWAATVQQETIDLTFLNEAGKDPVVTTAMVCSQLLRAPVAAGGAFTPIWSSSCPTGLVGAAPASPDGVLSPTCVVKVWARMPVELTFILIPVQIVQVNRQSVSLYERGAC